MSLYPPLSTIPVSEHIKEKDGSKIISTGEAVKFGEMSFRMITDDPFDITGFKLKENTYSPTTGIKINLDAQTHFNAKSTFRFADVSASKDADLANMVVSSGKVNEENPDESNYKEYNLDPIFDKEINNYTLTLLEYLDTIDITATQNDENASMKIKVPKRDSDGNLVYESDGTTIVYEEKDLNDKVPMEVTLNKLGEPNTEITVEVTAEDGATENTYKVVIKRPYGTIRGSVYTAPTASSNYFKSNIRIYKSDVVTEAGINWDNYKTIVGGDDLHQNLIALESQDYETKDDGTFEIYLVPGKYDVLIDKEIYLDNIFTSQEIVQDTEIDLGQIILFAGDIDKNGVVNSLDIATIKTRYAMYTTDEGVQEAYDVNLDTIINMLDISYVTVNYAKTREIN